MTYSRYKSLLKFKLGGSKFKYRPGFRQIYSYTVDVASLFNGTSQNESTLHIESTVKLGFISECEGILSVSDVSLSDNPNAVNVNDENEEDMDASHHANGDIFSEKLSECNLRFSFQDGVISEICPCEEEENWVLNFKRGLLSIFQNTMKRLDLDYTSWEEDVHGKCETTYTITGTKETNLLLTRTKDLKSCQSGSKFHSFLQSTPYTFKSVNERQSIIKSASVCKLSIDHNIYNEVVCEEIHKFEPFSNNAAGASTVVKQTLTLQSEVTATLEEQPPIIKRTNLLYDQVPTPKPTSGELKASRDALRQLCKLNTKDFQAQFSDIFTEFIHTARLLSYVALSSLYGHAGIICQSGKKHMFDALPHLGSSASVTLMKDIILNGSISEGIMYDWTNSIAFISRPNEAMMEAASQLLIHKGDHFTVLLSVTALAHTFCKQHRNCFSSDPIHQITKLLENRVSENSDSEFDVLKHDNILVSMKGLANVGIVSTDFKNTLFRIIENNNIDVSIRLAAIEIFIRLPCEENRRRFEDTFRNQTEDVEVRIASYLQVMRCPNYIIMRTIQHSLEIEEVNQVGSYVWSHLQNLLKSSVPNKVEIQSLLSDKNLKKKFSNDVRKFSHNYEGSIFFEEYNMGGSFESDVIFSPSSYVPKTANLNLTVDMFGESINIFEFNARVDGFEHYLESLFGPRGPWNAKNVQDKIPKMRWPRSNNYDRELISKTDKISQTYSKPRNNPKVSLGLKMFGNNMKYAILNGEQEIKEAVQKLNPESYFKRLISGKEINYNKAMMFMDSSYIVPTGAGFPMVLNSIGTVSVNVKMFGNLKAENFSKTKALDLIGEFRPSAAVDIVGSMSLDAFYASTAIKLKTNVHTSTALEGKLKIRGTDLISITFTTPNQKTDIFGARSELIVVNGGVETRQSGIEGTKISSSACVWPTVEEAIGLKLCTNYYYSNVTKIENAPSFILAGPSEYSLSLEKTDPSIKSYVFEYKWDKTTDANAISVTFDTPGSGRSRLLNANITFDALNNDISLVINSPRNVLTAHGKYKNTEDEKYIQMTLNVNNRKRFDASLSLKKLDGRNGYTYLPKAYLGVNGERVAEIQGTLKWVSKKGVGQCDVDLKFHTKRLTSQLFGYLSKTDASVGSNLKLYYKFVNTQEQRAALEILLANRSTRTLTALLGDLRLETSNYPHFNFESALKFQRAAGRLEGKFDVEVGAYTKTYKPNDPNRMKVVVEVRHKATSGGARFETKVVATRPSTDLNVGAEFSYSVTGPNTDMNALVKYAKDKEAAVNIFWSQPRGSLEFFEGQINVTLTGYSSTFLHVRVEEKHSSHYNVDLNAAWFSGHTINVHGIYQDKSTVKTSNHHLKIIIKSPHFSIIAADCQLYQDDVEFKIDVEANQANNDYGVYYKHSVFSLFDISTEGKIKYNNQVYSVTSSVNLRDRKQLLLEFHFDRFRDIHLELWNHNKEFHKTGGFEIKWDANRDPNQKLIATIEFRNPELYNYVGNFVISYPGRAINGVFEFFAKDRHFLTRSHITWSPIHKIAFSISTDFKSDVETLFVIKSELITPLEDWRKSSFNACYYHKRNMYSMNSSTHWHNNQHISIDLLRDYEATDTFIGYELKSALHSTIQNFPSFTVSAKHKQDSGKVETNLYTLLNPKNIFGIKSLWLIHENKNVKNLTGMVTLVTPFAGYNKGLLISKVYVINKKYVRGVADLDLDHKKYTVSVEGHYKKFTDNMFVFNVTTPKEKYKMITGKLGFLEEQRYLVGLVQYPTGTVGLEIKLNFDSLQKFDVIIYAATPIEFLETVLVVGKLNQEEADFRLGWNSLLAGFSGVWHYANITDFEYSYKIYTPIEGFKQNGIVAKLIFKEGLDFELSVKLAEKRLGATIIGRPKPKLLNELGIKTPVFHGNFENNNAEGDDDFEEIEDPINWTGYVEVDSMVYPIIKCSFDVDQKGNLYVLQGKLTLPSGAVEFKDEFDFMDVLNINNKLYFTTPYVYFKEATIITNVDIVIGYQYKLGFDVDYQNRSKTISMGSSLIYFLEEDDTEMYHNLSVHIHSPYAKLQKFDILAQLVRKDDNYRLNSNLATSDAQAFVDVEGTLNQKLWDATIIAKIKTPFVSIPETKIDLLNEFINSQRKIHVQFDMKRNKPTKINLLAVWKYESITNLKGSLMLETPIKNLEKTEFDILFIKKDNKGQGNLRLVLHPINIIANATIRDNEVQSWITSEFNNERRIITAKYEVKEMSPIKRKVQGTIIMNDKEYEVSGSINLLKDGWPKDAQIQIKPYGGTPLNLQYLVKQWSKNDIVTTMRLSQHLTFISLETSIKSKLKDHWDIHAQVNTSNERYPSFTVNSEITYADIIKGIFMDIHTPFEGVENSNFGLEYRFTSIGLSTKQPHSSLC
ncbi:hypothetical protein FQA39_LY07173 [Lamprigera yunnana]|nr:hypothetical protein FQA39_LY07173 [Lamprigera yunnana]